MPCHLNKSHKYRLTYFDAPGRAELIRWTFAFAGQEFEDVRIQGSDWPSLKGTTPHGTLPILDVDGKIIPESITIARYVARQTNLTGKDNFETALADAVVDYVNDAARAFSALDSEKDEKKKIGLQEDFVKTKLQAYLKVLEHYLQLNPHGDGFIVGSKPTWADFAVTIFLRNPAFDSSLLDNYKLLKAHQERVLGLKPIKEWIQKHTKN
ncbi:putative Hematopoietic prostaglandin D synthase [Hypsibius exemplaris]|uniref:glutathione transferase n=1 Tax=Hypsibius exemplaris TaxID=2072580 RepID=A0A9X6NES6_HYPEX|nr:putative Hematopoietic prostaglandin D synthase [Hypsibius exemplaris]